MHRSFAKRSRLRPLVRLAISCRVVRALSSKPQYRYSYRPTKEQLHTSLDHIRKSKNRFQISVRGAFKSQTKHIGIFSRSLGRNLHMQAVGPLLEAELCLAAHEGDCLHEFTARSRREGFNCRFSACRPGKSDRLQSIAFRSKTKIRRRVFLHVCVVKRAHTSEATPNRGGMGPRGSYYPRP